MAKDIVLETWSGENGEYCRIGRKDGRYWIETGEDFPYWMEFGLTRRYVPEMEALGYDPDPAGEAYYWVNPDENWHEDPEHKPPWLCMKGAKYALVKADLNE